MKVKFYRLKDTDQKKYLDKILPGISEDSESVLQINKLESGIHFRLDDLTCKQPRLFDDEKKLSKDLTAAYTVQGLLRTDSTIPVIAVAGRQQKLFDRLSGLTGVILEWQEVGKFEVLEEVMDWHQFSRIEYTVEKPEGFKAGSKVVIYSRNIDTLQCRSLISELMDMKNCVSLKVTGSRLGNKNTVYDLLDTKIYWESKEEGLDGLSEAFVNRMEDLKEEGIF